MKIRLNQGIVDHLECIRRDKELSSTAQNCNAHRTEIAGIRAWPGFNMYNTL
jgi:hypothetical protein